MIFKLNGCRGLIIHPAIVEHHGPPASYLAHLITAPLFEIGLTNLIKSVKAIAPLLLWFRRPWFTEIPVLPVSAGCTTKSVSEHGRTYGDGGNCPNHVLTEFSSFTFV